MSTTYCGACLTVAVRKSGDICARCRAEGHRPLREIVPDDDLPLMDVLDPLVLLERSLRQMELQQNRLDQAMRGDGLTQQPYRADLANEARKLAHDLSFATREWRQLKDYVKQMAEKASPEEQRQLFMQWYASQPAATQREMLQLMARLLNQQAADRRGGGAGA